MPNSKGPFRPFPVPTRLNASVASFPRFLTAANTTGTLTGNLPEVVFCMYHLTFAVFAPALIVGSCVERVKFPVMLVFTGIWSLLVYVPVCHWLWGGGWLAELGAIDFAGGIVVHTTSGIAALSLAKRARISALVFRRRMAFKMLSLQCWMGMSR